MGAVFCFRAMASAKMVSARHLLPSPSILDYFTSMLQPWYYTCVYPPCRFRRRLTSIHCCCSGSMLLLSSPLARIHPYPLVSRVRWLLRLLFVQIGVEVAQSNAAWLLEAGHCGGGSVNGTKVSCEKRWVGFHKLVVRQCDAIKKVVPPSAHRTQAGLWFLPSQVSSEVHRSP